MKSLKARADRASQLTLSCPVSDQRIHFPGTPRVTGFYLLSMRAFPHRLGLLGVANRLPRLLSAPAITMSQLPGPYNQVVCCKRTKNSAEFFAEALA